MLRIATPLFAVFVAALLVNLFARDRRPRLRRLVLLCALHLFAVAAGWVATKIGAAGWEPRIALADELIGAFLYVNVAAIVIIEVGLRRLRLAVAPISTDLAVGAGYIAVTLAALRTAGLNPTQTVATGAVVSAVVALSLQSTLGNVLGGVALHLDGSVRPGDWLQLENGRHGRVAAVRWRYTVLETRDHGTLIVPNGTLLSSIFTVLGRRGGEPANHRVSVQFHVDFRFPPDSVIAAITDALLSAPIPGVANAPAPHCLCMDLGNNQRQSCVLYAVRYHVLDLAQEDLVGSTIRCRIHAALRRANIPLAIPSSKVFEAKDNVGASRRQRSKDHAARTAALRSVELFAPLSDAEIDALADSMRFAPFASGEAMIKQGAVAHWLYVMTSGKAAVVAKLDSGEVVRIAEINAPACFGEMGLMTGEARLATVSAETQVDCYRLDRAAFAATIKQRPEIAREFSVLLAKRKVELLAARDGLGDAQRAQRRREESERILATIQSFFGLR